MFTVVITALFGVCTGMGLWLGGVLGYGWSAFFVVLAFVVANAVAGMMLQRRVKAQMMRVQGVLAAGQKQIQAKVARWQMQMRGPGSVQQAQAEIARDTKGFVADAIAECDRLHAFDLWVPLMKRQIATAKLQLYWMVKDFAHVDELMPKALFLDPTMRAMRIARMYMLGAPTAEIAKVYAKSCTRLRYNQNVLIAATWSWVLVRRGDADAAFKVLVRALEKSDNATLKANRDQLANNRVAHFSNTALGDQWFALLLEEPKMHGPRQRMQWR
jgi:hypothetical protein